MSALSHAVAEDTPSAAPGCPRLALSPLPKTWVLDIDGTLFRHNGHLAGDDELLPGVADFMARLSAEDKVVLMTARAARDEAVTRAALARHGIRFDAIVFDLPVGERVLVNDAKPSGLLTAHAVNVRRNAGLRELNDNYTVVDL